MFFLFRFISYYLAIVFCVSVATFDQVDAHRRHMRGLLEAAGVGARAILCFRDGAAAHSRAVRLEHVRTAARRRAVR